LTINNVNYGSYTKIQDDILLMSKLFESGIPTQKKLEVNHKSAPNLVKVK